MLRHHWFLLLSFVWIACPPGEAAVKEPPAPKEYQVKLRYSIDSPRGQHVLQYDALIKDLKAVGFKYEPGPRTDREDPGKNYLTGTIPSANARKILRNANVASVLLMPPKYVLPAKGTDPVKVRLTLVGGLGRDRQRVLADQVVTLLEDMGFQEAIAYDHRGFTRLVGTIPARYVETLLKDLRTLPEGWLVPEKKPRDLLDENGDLRSPLKTVSPLLTIEAVPEPAGVAPIKPLPEPQPTEKELEKVSPDVRALIGKEKTKRLRLEIILALTPGPNDRAWREELDDAAPSIVIEGRLGPLVTAIALAGEVPELARLPIVSVIRTPIPSRPEVVPVKGSKADNARVLRSLGLHRLKMPQRGVRVAVIDSDFQGYEELLQKKILPPKTAYVDLTAERNKDIRPDPFPGDPKEVGHGTRCALALTQALAGAGVDLVLVRVDAGAPHQLQEVARYINGEKYRSESLPRRLDEIEREQNELRKRREELKIERKRVLDNFGDEEENRQARKDYFAKERAYERDERLLGDRERRYLRLLRDERGLKGVEVVSCSLIWSTGYPVDGSSSLSRYFDDRPFKATLWFQSPGNTGGQVWAGLFRDTDANGVMEFVPPKTALPKDRWTPELNFLAWRPFGKPRELNLPAGARLKVSIQWREPHDPALKRQGEDLYRTPLAVLRLVLLRQRDPEGKDLPADDMEEVAHSMGYANRYGLPQRLTNSPFAATYEQVLEFTVPRAGRYALRVEGKVPPGIRPVGVPKLPAFEKTWELKPRIFVEVQDDASRGAGRPVFLDYATDQGTIGMPADARRLLTVGAADRSKKPQPYSATGPVMNLDLLAKPNVFVYEQGRLGPEGAAAYGTSLAAPYAAGLAARALYLGSPRVEFMKALRGRPAKVLRLPDTRE
jgi:hypothetical protein